MTMTENRSQAPEPKIDEAYERSKILHRSEIDRLQADFRKRLPADRAIDLDTIGIAQESISAAFYAGLLFAMEEYVQIERVIARRMQFWREKSAQRSGGGIGSSGDKKIPSPGASQPVKTAVPGGAPGSGGSR